jgi:hypothetical protein
MAVAKPGRVLAARPVFKKVSLMLTRRVRGRLFLLRPSDRTNGIVGYVVAVMEKRWRIKVHAIKDHCHVVLTAPHGNVVSFQRNCHQLVARAVNAHHGEFENLWSATQGSRVEAEEPDDLIGQIAYTMANAVEGRLVRYGHHWPGLRMAWPARPKVFRKPRGPIYGDRTRPLLPEQT